MKNKLIINIILVYFVLLAIVLVVQMNISKNNQSSDPLISNTRYSDTLSACIVLHDRSPVMLVKQKQRLVSQKNAAAVPVIENDEVLVPIEFFDEAYNAVISSDKDKQTATVRLNNKALMVDGKTDSVKLVSASGESTLTSKGVAIFKNNSTYINLQCFAEGFNKELKVCDGMALLSDNKINLKDEYGFVSEVAPRVYNLPSVDEQQKLESLLGSNQINIFDSLDLGFLSEKSPAATLGLDAITTDSPSMLRTDGNNLYYINDNELIIASNNNSVLSQTKLNLSEVYGIYLSNNLVSVVGNGNVQRSDGKTFNGCVINIYDVSTPASPQLERTIAAEGSYTNAYKTDNTVYIFTKKAAESADSYGMPSYFDSENDTVGETKSLSDVHYVPEMADKNYTSLVSFNAADLTRAVNVYPLLGCGENYTVSGDSLYIAASSSVGTSVYKLVLSDGTMQYTSAASALGDIPDSACINEYNNVLRLASKSGNNTDITLLDDKMDVVDSINGINLDGEFVSTRFIGSRAYLVSNSTTLPITAIDLGDKIKKLGSIALPTGTMAVRNLDAEHFICIKNNGEMSMLSISDMDNQYELFNVQTNGSCSSYKDILLNTTDGVLAVPVDIDKSSEADTEINSVENTEIISEESNESAAESTAELAIEEFTEENAENNIEENIESATKSISDANNEETTEATTEETTKAADSDSSVWHGILVYKTEPTAFTQIAEIECDVTDADTDNMLYKDSTIYIMSNGNIKITKLNLDAVNTKSVESAETTTEQVSE